MAAVVPPVKKTEVKQLILTSRSSFLLTEKALQNTLFLFWVNFTFLHRHFVAELEILSGFT